MRDGTVSLQGKVSLTIKNKHQSLKSHLSSEIQSLLSNGLDVGVRPGSVATTCAVLIVAAVDQLLLRIVILNATWLIGQINFV